jgi:hypothetical protein
MPRGINPHQTYEASSPKPLDRYPLLDIERAGDRLIDVGDPRGYKVRLLLGGEYGLDSSFWYRGDSLPYQDQVIEVASDYHAEAKQARVTRVTPDVNPEIHAIELTEP